MIEEKDCSGCTDDFYNGHNDLGVTRCWNRDHGTMVHRLAIPINLAPPYLHIQAKPVPSCYKKPGYVMVKPTSIRKDGYWQ